MVSAVPALAASLGKRAAAVQKSADSNSITISMPARLVVTVPCLPKNPCLPTDPCRSPSVPPPECVLIVGHTF
jgi:hypothetical protein